MTKSSTDLKNKPFVKSFEKTIRLINPDFTDIPQKHLEFINLLDNDNKYTCAKRPRGFGKTFLSVETLLFHLAINREIPNSGLGEISSMVVIGSCANYCTFIKQCISDTFKKSSKLKKLFPLAVFNGSYMEFCSRDGKDKFGIRIMNVNEELRDPRIFNEKPSLIVMDDAFEMIDRISDNVERQNKIVIQKLTDIKYMANPKKSKIFYAGTNIPDIMFNTDHVIFESPEEYRTVNA